MSSSSSGCSCPNCPAASCCFQLTCSGVVTGSCCGMANGTFQLILDTSFTFYCLWNSIATDSCQGGQVVWEMYHNTGTDYYLACSEGFSYDCPTFDCMNGGVFTNLVNFGSCTGMPASITVTSCGGSGSSTASSSSANQSSFSSSSSMGCPCCCCGSSSSSQGQNSQSSGGSSSSSNPVVNPGCVDCPSGNLTYYYITAAGITGSADCLSHNVTDYQMTARGPLSSACTWDSFYPAFPAVDLWSLFITGVGTAQVYAFDRFGNIQTFYNCNTFNCLTANTFTLGTVTSCSGWPATITISTS